MGRFWLGSGDHRSGHHLGHRDNPGRGRPGRSDRPARRTRHRHRRGGRDARLARASVRRPRAGRVVASLGNPPADRDWWRMGPGVSDPPGPGTRDPARRRPGSADLVGAHSHRRRAFPFDCHSRRGVRGNCRHHCRGDGARRPRAHRHFRHRRRPRSGMDGGRVRPGRAVAVGARLASGAPRRRHGRLLVRLGQTSDQLPCFRPVADRGRDPAGSASVRIAAAGEGPGPYFRPAVGGPDPAKPRHRRGLDRRGQRRPDGLAAIS